MFLLLAYPDPFREPAAHSVSQSIAQLSPDGTPSTPRGHRRNVSETSVFNKVFANETSQFLAPYEASVKSRSDSSSPPTGDEATLTATSEGTQRLLIGSSASHVSTNGLKKA